MTDTKLCTFPDCGRPGSSRTLCGAHYKQARRGQALHPIAARPARLCTVDGCDKPHNAKGLCLTHYNATRPRKGPRVFERRGCDIEGCEGKHLALGYCVTHYNRLRRGSDLTRPTRVQSAPSDRPKRTRSKPSVLKVTPPTSSRLPDGWEKVTPQKKTPSVPRPREYPELHLTVIEPEVIAAAREVLASWDALDLAEMLGIGAA